MSGNVQRVFPLDSNWFSSPDIICVLWLVAIFPSPNYPSVFAIGTWVWPPWMCFISRSPFFLWGQTVHITLLHGPLYHDKVCPTHGGFRHHCFISLSIEGQNLTRFACMFLGFHSPLVLFCICWDPIPDEINSGEEGLISTHSLERSIMVKKAWQSEPEVAGHTASTVRRQRQINAAAQFTLSYSVRLGA